MDNQIEEIKGKIDIIEFINSFVSLKRAGRNFKACCPFHQEKSPSFVVSPDRQIWHCFGTCGEGGDVIKFLMKWDNLTFHEALVELAKRAGVTLKDVKVDQKEVSTKEKIIQMNYLAFEFYHYVLTKTPIGKKCLEYLHNRGINDKIVEKFGLGYAPSSWDSLLNFLKKKNFKEYEMYEAGLVVKNDNGRYYDRFRGRLMFPIRDIKSNIIAFSGRILDPDEKTAKYVNTPETPIYHKRESLFGIHIAKDAVRKENNVLIVEGEFDMITPFEHGINNVVAIKGSALTREQLTILKRYTSRITLALDTDAAGEEAMMRGIAEAERMEFEIYIVRFEGGKDPDELARKDFVSFKKALESPLPIYDYLIIAIQNKYPGETPFQKKHVGEEVIPYISRIQNPIIQSHYIKKLAKILEVSEDSVQKMIFRQRQANRKPKIFLTKSTKPLLSKVEESQRYLLSYIFQHETPYVIADKVFAILDPNLFTIPSWRKIIEHFSEYKKTYSQFTVNDFIQSLPAELQAAADEVYLSLSSEVDLTKENYERIAINLKVMLLKNSLAQEDLDDEKAKKLSAELSEALQQEKVIA